MGIQGKDLVIQAAPTSLVLGHDLRLKAALAVAGDVNGQFAKVALERLFALAISGVTPGICYRLIFGVTKVLSHLDFKRTLHQALGELLEKPVFSNQVFRLFVIRQQSVYQFVAYGHFSAFEKTGSYLPSNRLHKI
jgi:hypothetical protein